MRWVSRKSDFWITPFCGVRAAILLAGCLSFSFLSLSFTPELPCRGGDTGELSDHSAEPLSEAEREQHLVRLGVKRWHALGFLGQGVRIAVLDTGFRGYKKY